MAPRSSRSVVAETAPTRARSTRTPANKRAVIPPSPAQSDSDDSPDQAESSESSEEEEETENKPKARGGKNLQNNNKPTSRITRDRTSTASDLSTSSAVPKSSARLTKGKAALKKTVVAQVVGARRSTRASSVAASVNEDEEEEEEEEEIVAPKRRAGGRRAIASPSPSVPDEEEEDVKPIIKRSRKKVSIAAPPSPEPVKEEEEADLETVASEEDTVDEEEARPVPSPSKPLKRTPTKPKSKRIVPESPSASEEDDDVQEMLKPVEPVPDVDTEMAAVPEVVPEVEEEVATPEAIDQPPPPIIEEPAPAPIPIVNLAPTAHDLASAARMAALNHAANEAQREKERKGKPRLVIHQMVLEDFKSYRGRGVIGPFHKVSLPFHIDESRMLILCDQVFLVDCWTERFW